MFNVTCLASQSPTLATATNHFRKARLTQLTTCPFDAIPPNSSYEKCLASLDLRLLSIQPRTKQLTNIPNPFTHFAKLRHRWRRLLAHRRSVIYYRSFKPRLSFSLWAQGWIKGTAARASACQPAAFLSLINHARLSLNLKPRPPFHSGLGILRGQHASVYHYFLQKVKGILMYRASISRSQVPRTTLYN